MVDHSNFRLTWSGAGSVHHINRAVGAQDLDGDGKIIPENGDKKGDDYFYGGKASLGVEGSIYLGKGFYFLPGLSVVVHFAKNKIDSYTVPDPNGPLGDPELGTLSEDEAQELQDVGYNVQAGDSKDPRCYNAGRYLCHPDGLYKQDATSHYIGAKLDLSVAGRIGKVKGNPVLLGAGITVELRQFFLNASAPMTIYGLEISQRFSGSQPLLWGLDAGAKIFLELPVGQRFIFTLYFSANFGELKFFPEGVRHDSGISVPQLSGEQQLAGGFQFAVALGPVPEDLDAERDRLAALRRREEARADREAERAARRTDRAVEREQQRAARQARGDAVPHPVDDDDIEDIEDGDGGETAAGSTSRSRRVPPDEPEEMDTDGDGILDRDDDCPRDAEDGDDFKDTDGCADLDNDEDGLHDANSDGTRNTQDACPNNPEDTDGFDDTDGCPDPDNDGDGIPDVNDNCPNKAEDFDQFEDENGCPERDVAIPEGRSSTTPPVTRESILENRGLSPTQQTAAETDDNDVSPTAAPPASTGDTTTEAVSVPAEAPAVSPPPATDAGSSSDASGATTSGDTTTIAALGTLRDTGDDDDSAGSEGGDEGEREAAIETVEGDLDGDGVRGMGDLRIERKEKEEKKRIEKERDAAAQQGAAARARTYRADQERLERERAEEERVAADTQAAQDRAAKQTRDYARREWVDRHPWFKNTDFKTQKHDMLTQLARENGFANITELLQTLHIADIIHLDKGVDPADVHTDGEISDAELEQLQRYRYKIEYSGGHTGSIAKNHFQDLKNLYQKLEKDIEDLERE